MRVGLVPALDLARRLPRRRWVHQNVPPSSQAVPVRQQHQHWLRALNPVRSRRAGPSRMGWRQPKPTTAAPGQERTVSAGVAGRRYGRGRRRDPFVSPSFVAVRHAEQLDRVTLTPSDDPTLSCLAVSVRGLVQGRNRPFRAASSGARPVQPSGYRGRCQRIGCGVEQNRSHLEVFLLALVIDLAAALHARSYLGRGLVVGRLASGTAFVVYFLTGRSAASRDRELRRDGPSDVEVADTSGGPTNRQRRSRRAARPSAVGRYPASDTWSVQTFEPDSPIFTPRICVAWELTHGRPLLGCARRSERPGGA